MNFTAYEQLKTVLRQIDGAYAPNTLRAYRAGMLEFIRHCEEIGATALPASPTTVANFLLHCTAQNIKTATFRRKISSISAIHRLSYLEDPTKHPEVKITIRKISRQLGTRFEQAFPVTRTILDKFLAVCGKDLRGLRNRALLLAYDSMRRRSELVSCVLMKWSGSRIQVCPSCFAKGKPISMAAANGFTSPAVILPFCRGRVIQP